MNSSYVFVVGRTPQLAARELSSFFPGTSFTHLTDHAIHIETTAEWDPSDLIKILGGTVTITRVVKEISEVTPETIAHVIGKDHGGNSSLTFGISSLGSTRIDLPFLASVKKELVNGGISTRYVENKEGNTLSAIVITRQHVQEYVLIPSPIQTTFVCKTIAVQDVDQWVHRDYDRPHADPKRGMLPPKVARMLVNIAGTAIPQSEARTLLDPFCGMGTILGEAMLSGWNVIGSDISPEVVAFAKENVGWIKTQYNLDDNKKYECMVSDAVHISTMIASDSIDAIVTEQFLGSPKFAIQKQISIKEIKNTVKGLEKLYIGCLKDWRSILRKNGIILIALPEFSVNGHELFVKKVIDSCETLGYSIQDGPIAYGRPGATVTRKFYIFKKV